MTTIQELLSNREKYFATLLRIENKERQDVSFIPNRVQRQFMGQRTGRDIVLKARQLGFTSVIMADYLVDCVTRPGTVSVVVSHEDHNTQRLFQKARKFYDSIPDTLKPRLGHGSATEMTWPSIGSTFYIGTARAQVFGRGDTIHNFLGSEISRWPDPDKIMTAVRESVPMVGGSIVLESTPNGEGNYFHIACEQALKGEGTFKLHFYPWWENDEYQLAADHELTLEQDRGVLVLDDEEQDLVNRHQLTDNQIRWRRWKIADMAQGTSLEEAKRKFQEEYPEDEQKCFLTTGERRLYPYEVLDALMLRCGPAVRMTEDGLEIWREPEPMRQYIVSADPTGGQVDDAAAVVWDVTNSDEPKFCATLVGLYDPLTLAGKLVRIASLYNQAMLAIERNGPGLAVLTVLRDYPNIYHRHDTTTGREGSVPGWITTNPNKNVMAVEFGRQMRQAEIYDRRILMQARGMRRDGHIIYSYGKDDLFMAAAIGLAVRDTAPMQTVGVTHTYGWKGGAWG